MLVSNGLCHECEMDCPRIKKKSTAKSGTCFFRWFKAQCENSPFLAVAAVTKEQWDWLFDQRKSEKVLRVIAIRRLVRDREDDAEHTRWLKQHPAYIFPKFKNRSKAIVSTNPTIDLEALGRPDPEAAAWLKMPIAKRYSAYKITEFQIQEVIDSMRAKKG